MLNTTIKTLDFGQEMTWLRRNCFIPNKNHLLQPLKAVLLSLLIDICFLHSADRRLRYFNFPKNKIASYRKNLVISWVEWLSVIMERIFTQNCKNWLKIDPIAAEKVCFTKNDAFLCLKFTFLDLFFFDDFLLQTQKFQYLFYNCLCVTVLFWSVTTQSKH